MASVKNLYVDQGDTFDAQLKFYDDTNVLWQLEDYTASATIKKSYYSTSSVEFEVSFPVDRSTGAVNLQLSATKTLAMDPGRYVYDVVLTTPGGNNIRVLEGIITINPGITRAP